jgi:hypothetical protein
LPTNEPAALGAEPVDDTHVSVGAVVVAILLTVGAGVAVSYGLARDDPVWLLSGAAAFAPVVVASTHGAARAVQENRRTAGTAACAGLGILFIVVIVVAEPWWGSDHNATGPALVLGASAPSAHVYLHGTPGGTELTRARDPEPLVANTAYRFSCQVKLSDDTRWLRLADSEHWVPAFVLLTKSGRPAPLFPTC